MSRNHPKLCSRRTCGPVYSLSQEFVKQPPNYDSLRRRFLNKPLKNVEIAGQDKVPPRSLTKEEKACMDGLEKLKRKWEEHPAKDAVANDIVRFLLNWLVLVTAGAVTTKNVDEYIHEVFHCFRHLKAERLDWEKSLLELHTEKIGSMCPDYFLHELSKPIEIAKYNECMDCFTDSI